MFEAITYPSALLSFILSFLLFKREQTGAALLCILLGGLLLRIGISADPYLHDWDERYHALVAKNMLRHPFLPTLYETPLLSFDYKSWTGNHV